MSAWLTVWFELAPPLFVWATVVVDVLLEDAAPVVIEAVLFPVLSDVALFVARTAGVAGGWHRRRPT